MKDKTSKRLAMVLALALCAVACGQKGPLVLAQDKAPEPPQQQQPKKSQ